MIEIISLNHKSILTDRLKNTRVFLSEYSFASLYLFRAPHNYHVLTNSEGTFILGKTYDGKEHIMPTTDLTKHQHELTELLRLSQSYDFIYPIPEAWLSLFTDKKIMTEFSENDSDYVCGVEKISTYKGPQLHRKKNLLNKFFSLYTSDPRPLIHSRMKDAYHILDAWQDETEQSKEQTDYVPCHEALELYDELVLCGGIYYVDQEPAGFIIGEEINDKMFALHFAKGKKKFKGLYQYMFNHFSQVLPKKYEFLNFEQDMGKIELKIAKSSYVPDQLLKKYRIKYHPENSL